MTDTIWFSLVALPAALALLILASDLFLSGAIAVAGRLKLPEFVVGSIIVAVGTSAPELAINIAAGLEGQGDIVIANLVGSNIVNVCLGIGLAGLFVAYGAIGADYTRALVVGLAAALALLATTVMFGSGGQAVIPQVAGVGLTILFAAYVWQSLRGGDGGDGEAEAALHGPAKPLFISVLMLIGGCVAMALLADQAVVHAVKISTYLEIPEAVIGATVIAAGGSLPEVFSCISAARKGRPNIVLGNIAGSQIFNLLGILGVTALVTEIRYSQVLAVDMALLVGATAVLLVLSRLPALRRLIPPALLALYGVYGVYLVYVSA